MKILADRKNLRRFFARQPLPARKLFLILVFALFCGLAFLVWEARSIYLKTEKTLENEILDRKNQTEIRFSRVPLAPRREPDVSIWQSAGRVRSLVRFEDSFFAATDGGLLELSLTGEIVRHYTILDGLPESDLTALAVFQSKLFIGTKSKGLVDFDGEDFFAYRLENHETKSVTALFSDQTALFVGTYSGGLLVYDGSRMREIKAFEKSLAHVTFLRHDAATLFVGTFESGLWTRRNNVWKNFKSADGLPSNRVVGVETIGENLFVATDLGVASGSTAELFGDAAKTFRQQAILPALSSFINTGKRIYLTRDDGDIYAFSADLKFLDASKLEKINWKRPEKLSGSRLVKTNEEIFLLSSEGLRRDAENDGELALSDFGEADAANSLAENMISALSFDAENRLWVGTFRRGIDVFLSNGKKARHLEADSTREINFLAPGGKEKSIYAATSAGVFRFDAAYLASPVNEKLPPQSSTHFAFDAASAKSNLAVATAKGLLRREDEKVKVYSTFHGLPANTVNATLFARGALFAATTGGLAQIENGKVARVYKTSNSPLANNWITALCASGERIFVGTYGGGIYELQPSGELRSFVPETGKNFVNPNALFADRAALYAGTLEGVWRLDLQTQKWTHIKDVLPAETVLSITGNDESIFFGTTNGIARIKQNFWLKS